jgi:hypothetical protein
MEGLERFDRVEIILTHALCPSALQSKTWRAAVTQVLSWMRGMAGMAAAIFCLKYLPPHTHERNQTVMTAPADCCDCHDLMI